MKTSPDARPARSTWSLSTNPVISPNTFPSMRHRSHDPFVGVAVLLEILYVLCCGTSREPR